MEMPRKDKPISLAIDPELIAEVEAFIESQEFPPTKRQVFEAALRMFLKSKGKTKSKTKDK
jgi:metal-responsive CopG/Arc/MetJ family transcriptional regulator